MSTTTKSSTAKSSTTTTAKTAKGMRYKCASCKDTGILASKVRDCATGRWKPSAPVTCRCRYAPPASPVVTAPQSRDVLEDVVRKCDALRGPSEYASIVETCMEYMGKKSPKYEGSSVEYHFDVLSGVVCRACFKEADASAVLDMVVRECRRRARAVRIWVKAGYSVQDAVNAARNLKVK